MNEAAALVLSPHSRAWLRESEVTIVAAVGVDQVLVILADGHPKCVAVAELSAAPVGRSTEITCAPDLSTVSEKEWQLMAQLAGAVRQLDDAPHKTVADVEAAARAVHIKSAWMYRLLAKWRRNGRLATALLREKRGPKFGGSRLA